MDVIAKKSNNPRWAWDCYRRFIQMYSDVVMEVGKKYFEQLIDEMKARKGVTQDVELTAEDLKELAGQFKAEYKSKIGQDFPTDPKEQLMDEAMKLANKIAKGPLNCYSSSKLILNKSFETNLEDLLKEETEAQAAARLHPNGDEGLAAFLEKRKANFQ